MKKALAAINPQVRQSGITLIGVLYMYMGPPLRMLFEDEKAALLLQIDAEIEKVKDQPLPEPTRGITPSSREDKDDDGEEEDAEATNIVDLIPRNDIRLVAWQ